MQRALLQFSELLRVQTRLRAEGIPMLFFKGQMLAQQAYGNLGLRSCFDLDLFVQESDVLQVKQVLAGLGYRPEFPFLSHHEADLLRMECEYTFIRQDGQVRIDLQWRPRARYFSFPVSSAALWSRAERVSLQGQEVDTFALNDLVLLLIVHGAKHTWHRLEQVCALAALAHRSPALDWPGIERAARDHGAARMLYVAVQLVVTHFAAPVPADLTARAAADRVATALAGNLPPGGQPIRARFPFGRLCERICGCANGWRTGCGTAFGWASRRPRRTGCGSHSRPICTGCTTSSDLGACCANTPSLPGVRADRFVERRPLPCQPADISLRNAPPSRRASSVGAPLSTTWP